jgi:hypothetical protein
MGRLVFRCSKISDEFDSGFTATAAELARIASSATMHLKCKVCGELHEFKVRQGRIAEDQSE